MSKVVESTGLVPVKMLKSYGSNSRGEIAGFLPEVAEELVAKKHATFNLKAAASPVQKSVEAGSAEVVDTKGIKAENATLQSENDELKKQIEELTKAQTPK